MLSLIIQILKDSIPDKLRKELREKLTSKMGKENTIFLTEFLF